MTVEIVKLSRLHDRTKFECGEPSLNNYLQRMAMQHDERNLGRTFVAIESNVPEILGYYTLASGKVLFENLPHTKKLPPAMPVPVILLGRLAVDIHQQGTGLGKLLLLHALWKTQSIAKSMGVFAVEVDAVHERAAHFYLKYGFTPLLDNPLHLYLSMQDIEALGLDFDTANSSAALG